MIDDVVERGVRAPVSSRLFLVVIRNKNTTAAGCLCCQETHTSSCSCSRSQIQVRIQTRRQLARAPGVPRCLVCLLSVSFCLSHSAVRGHTQCKYRNAALNSAQERRQIIKTALKFFMHVSTVQGLVHDAKMAGYDVCLMY